jgi:RNase H-fold protein (predicted Holliday junction resolvase)
MKPCLTEEQCYTRLATAIVVNAITEKQEAKNAIERLNKLIEKSINQPKVVLNGLKNKRFNRYNSISKINAFAKSSWCEDLCEVVGIDVELVRQKVASI